MRYPFGSFPSPLSIKSHFFLSQIEHNLSVTQPQNQSAAASAASMVTLDNEQDWLQGLHSFISQGGKTIVLFFETSIYLFIYY
jgi:hypothetical protein